MGQGGSPASNLVYDLVAIQYHALKGAQVYEQYLQDAQGDADAKQFIEQVRDEDAKRAEKAHDLLAKLTKDSGIKAA
jgi:cell division protein FtsB